MVNINDFRKFINALSNKDTNGAQSPDEFNSSLPVVLALYINRVKKKISDFQITQNKNYTLIAEYENTLLDIMKTSTLSINQYGVSTIPSDCIKTRGLYYNYITQNPLKVVPYQIREVSQSDFAGYGNSQLNHPKKKEAVACYLNGIMKFLPVDLGKAELVYYYDYPKPFWAYTMVNNQEEYTSGTGDNGTSVDIPLSPESINEFAIIYSQYLAAEIKEEWLEQFAQGEEAKNGK